MSDWDEALRRATAAAEGEPWLSHFDEEALPREGELGEDEDEELELARIEAVDEALSALLLGPQPGPEALAQLHRALADGPLDARLELVLESLSEGAEDLEAMRVEALAECLITEGRELASVQLGLALACLSPTPATQALATRVGAHPRLTLFAAMLLDGEDAAADLRILALAERAQGAARDALVQRLLGASQSEVRRWLLSTAFDPEQHPVGDALRLAALADLAGELRRPSAALLRGAGWILSALFDGDEDADIDDYDEAAAAVEAYVAALEQDETARDALALATLARVHHFLLGDELEADAEALGVGVDAEFAWRERESASGWTPTRRRQIAAAIEGLMESGSWPLAVREGLEAEGRAAYAQALIGADLLGIETREADLARLRRDPSWVELWARVAGADGEGATTQEFVDAVASSFDLEAIGSGAELRYDFDAEAAVHEAAASVAWTCLRGSWTPWSLLAALMQSPWVRVRAMALEVAEESLLGATSMDAQGAAFADALPRWSAVEPEAELAAAMDGLAAQAQAQR